MSSGNMSLEDFLTFIKGLGLHINEGDPSNTRYRYGKSGKGDNTPYIYVEWSTGGIEGGSCWGGENRPYSSNNLPEELTSLDLILENIKPDLSFLQYKSIVNKTVEHDTRTLSEYYGNSTNYTLKKCNLQTLYTELKERGFV